MNDPTNAANNSEAWGPEILRLYDRLSRAAEKGKSIQLSSVEVDLLVLTGGYEAVLQAMLAESKRVSKARLDAIRPSLSSG